MSDVRDLIKQAIRASGESGMGPQELSNSIAGLPGTVRNEAIQSLVADGTITLHKRVPLSHLYFTVQGD